LETAKVTLAALILLSIFGMMLYYSQMKPTVSQPNRLVIVVPSQLSKDQVASLKIQAVNNNGEVMKTRQDLIEFTILSLENSSIGLKGESGVVWSQRLSIRLERGVAEILIKGNGVETVTLTAKQLEGETPLAQGISLVNIE
jgi:hypothetical protein